MRSGSLPGSGDDHAGIEAALANLDPSARAALELSIRHRRTPREVADFTGIDETQLVELRHAAIDSIAADLGIAGPGSRGEVVRLLKGRRGQPPVAADDEATGDEEETEERHGETPAAATRPAGPSRRWLLAVVLLIGLVVAIVVIASAGGSEPVGTPAGGAEEGVPDGGDPPPPEPVALSPLPGTAGKGAVEAVLADASGEGRLAISLTGLPDPAGEYRAWLYTSLIDSRPLGAIRAGNGTIEAALPPDADAYEFLDVSIQERGSEPHSGRSVFRIPVSDLDAGG